MAEGECEFFGGIQGGGVEENSMSMNVITAPYPMGGVPGTEGPLNAGTCADDSAIGTVTWTSPENAEGAADGVFATAVGNTSAQTHYLKATDFGFSIPVGATIDGIVAEIYAKRNLSGVDTASTRSIKGGVIGGDDMGVSDSVGSSLNYFTHGSPSDLWGQTWTAADINAADFGIAFTFRLDINETGTNRTVSVDHIRVTVYYTS